jgi:hypothetical protein
VGDLIFTSNKKKIDVIFHLGACTNTLENNWGLFI